MLEDVITKLRKHGDDEYAGPLEEAVRRGLDNPSTMRTLVEAVMMTMKRDSEDD